MQYNEEIEQVVEEFEPFDEVMENYLAKNFMGGPRVRTYEIPVINLSRTPDNSSSTSAKFSTIYSFISESTTKSSIISTNLGINPVISSSVITSTLRPNLETKQDLCDTSCFDTNMDVDCSGTNTNVDCSNTNMDVECETAIEVVNAQLVEPTPKKRRTKRDPVNDNHIVCQNCPGPKQFGLSCPECFIYQTSEQFLSDGRICCTTMTDEYICGCVVVSSKTMASWIIGRVINVWWERYNQWSQGTILCESIKEDGGTHDVQYDGDPDGPISEKLTSAKREKWYFLD